MPDWQTIVLRKLGRVRLSPPTRQEVIEELAAHMEDSYEAELSRGAKVAAAEIATLNAAGDWSHLRRAISGTREDYMSRSRTLWLPGLASLVIGMVVQASLARFGPRPAVWMFSNTALIIQWWWIVTLPFAARGCLPVPPQWRNRWRAYYQRALPSLVYGGTAAVGVCRFHYRGLWPRAVGIAHPGHGAVHAGLGDCAGSRSAAGCSAFPGGQLATDGGLALGSLLGSDLLVQFRQAFRVFGGLPKTRPLVVLGEPCH